MIIIKFEKRKRERREREEGEREGTLLRAEYGSLFLFVYLHSTKYFETQKNKTRKTNASFFFVFLSIYTLLFTHTNALIY